MQKLNKTVIAGATALGLSLSFAQNARAENGYYPAYEPDASVTMSVKIPLLGNKNYVIAPDFALLGPNGEETALFYATLDPFHGEIMNESWHHTYDIYLKNGELSHSTDKELVTFLKHHIQSHGFPGDMLDKIYRTSLQKWQENKECRTNGHNGHSCLTLSP